MPHSLKTMDPKWPYFTVGKPNSKQSRSVNVDSRDRLRIWKLKMRPSRKPFPELNNVPLSPRGKLGSNRLC